MPTGDPKCNEEEPPEGNPHPVRSNLREAGYDTSGNRCARKAQCKEANTHTEYYEDTHRGARRIMVSNHCPEGSEKNDSSKGRLNYLKGLETSQAVRITKHSTIKEEKEPEDYDTRNSADPHRDFPRITCFEEERRPHNKERGLRELKDRLLRARHDSVENQHKEWQRRDIKKVRVRIPQYK